MTRPALDSTDLSWLAGLARALVRDASAADDLAQDTVVAALRQSIPRGVPIRVWLRSVARRLAARHFRTDARRVRRERRAAREESMPDAADLIERAEIAELVTAAARRLPEPYRRAILLRFLEGRTAEEVARVEGMPVDTVRWRVRRGLSLLREELMRSDGRDWQAWSALLVPLAGPGRSAGAAATAGASVSWWAAVASWSVMKTTMMFAGTALACLALWLVLRPLPEASAVPVSSAGGTAAVPSTAADPLAERVVSPPERALVPDGASARASEPPAARSLDLRGLVVDEAGDPIAGAQAYLLVGEERERRGRASKPPRVRAESDGAGAFRLAAGEWRERSAQEVWLGVSANGFLRRVTPLAAVEQQDGAVRVVLARGAVLTGRVVDEAGLPVVGLELLAHTAFAGVDHVSPSQRRLRAWRLDFAGADYDQCRATTDARGEVEFTGLPTGELEILPLDPGWVFRDPRIVQADGVHREWVAERRLGVRLLVFDARTGAPVERAAATFRFESTFANDEVENFGQWVGRGRGEVSFVLGDALLPGLEKRTMTRAAFYGTVRAADGPSVPWRAEPIENPAGVVGVVDVRVEVDPIAQEQTPAEVETGTVELDVRYADGVPFAGALAVRWSARPDDGNGREPLRGKSRLRAVAPGRYVLEVATGRIDLEAADAAAAGTFPPATCSLRCFATQPSRQFLTLPRGGTLRIERPAEWRGQWHVRASYRDPGTEEWRGSWGYGTGERWLVLDGMRSAEWRFELRRGSATAEEVVVRTAAVRVGETVDVRG